MVSFLSSPLSQSFVGVKTGSPYPLMKREVANCDFFPLLTLHVSKKTTDGEKKVCGATNGRTLENFDLAL